MANHNTYNGLGLIDVITSGIFPTGPNGELNSSCSTVDAGLLNQYDGFMPPGVGGVRADLGMYGGPGNTIWGGTEIPDGEPEISQVVDLPNDQGGSVGIQYTEVFLIMDTLGMILRATHFGEIWMSRI